MTENNPIKFVLSLLEGEELGSTHNDVLTVLLADTFSRSESLEAIAQAHLDGKFISFVREEEVYYILPQHFTNSMKERYEYSTGGYPIGLKPLDLAVERVKECLLASPKGLEYHQLSQYLVSNGYGTPKQVQGTLRWVMPRLKADPQVLLKCDEDTFYASALSVSPEPHQSLEVTKPRRAVTLQFTGVKSLECQIPSREASVTVRDSACISNMDGIEGASILLKGVSAVTVVFESPQDVTIS